MQQSLLQQSAGLAAEPLSSYPFSDSIGASLPTPAAPPTAAAGRLIPGAASPPPPPLEAAATTVSKRPESISAENPPVSAVKQCVDLLHQQQQKDTSVKAINLLASSAASAAAAFPHQPFIPEPAATNTSTAHTSSSGRCTDSRSWNSNSRRRGAGVGSSQEQVFTFSNSGDNSTTYEHLAGIPPVPLDHGGPRESLKCPAKPSNLLVRVSAKPSRSSSGGSCGGSSSSMRGDGYKHFPRQSSTSSSGRVSYDLDGGTRGGCSLLRSYSHPKVLPPRQPPRSWGCSSWGPAAATATATAVHFLLAVASVLLGLVVATSRYCFGRWCKLSPIAKRRVVLVGLVKVLILSIYWALTSSTSSSSSGGHGPPAHLHAPSSSSSSSSSVQGRSSSWFHWVSPGGTGAAAAAAAGDRSKDFVCIPPSRATPWPDDSCTNTTGEPAAATPAAAAAGGGGGGTPVGPKPGRVLLGMSRSMGSGSSRGLRHGCSSTMVGSSKSGGAGYVRKRRRGMLQAGLPGNEDTAPETRGGGQEEELRQQQQQQEQGRQQQEEEQRKRQQHQHEEGVDLQQRRLQQQEHGGGQVEEGQQQQGKNVSMKDLQLQDQQQGEQQQEDRQQQQQGGLQGEQQDEGRWEVEVQELAKQQVEQQQQQHLQQQQQMEQQQRVEQQLLQLEQQQQQLGGKGARSEQQQQQHDAHLVEDGSFSTANKQLAQQQQQERLDGSREVQGGRTEEFLSLLDTEQLTANKQRLLEEEGQPQGKERQQRQRIQEQWEGDGLQAVPANKLPQEAEEDAGGAAASPADAGLEAPGSTAAGVTPGPSSSSNSRANSGVSSNNSNARSSSSTSADSRNGSSIGSGSAVPVSGSNADGSSSGYNSSSSRADSSGSSSSSGGGGSGSDGKETGAGGIDPLTMVDNFTIALVNDVEFHHEVTLGVMTALQRHRKHLQVYVHPTVMRAQKNTHSFGLLHYIQTHMPGNVVKDAYYKEGISPCDVAIFLSPEFSIEYYRTFIKVAKPRMVIIFIHEPSMESRRLRYIINMHRLVGVVTLAPHVAASVNRVMRGMHTHWMMPTPEVHCNNTCWEGFALQGKFEGNRRDYTRLWNAMLQLHPDPFHQQQQQQQWQQGGEGEGHSNSSSGSSNSGSVSRPPQQRRYLQQHQQQQDSVKRHHKLWQQPSLQLPTEATRAATAQAAGSLTAPATAAVGSVSSLPAAAAAGPAKKLQAAVGSPRQPQPRINLMGSGDVGKLQLPKVLQQQVVLYQGLSYEDYYDTLCRSLAMLPLFNSSSGYLQDKISSSVLASVTAGVPLVVPPAFLKTYTAFKEEHVIIKDDDEGEVDVMTDLMTAGGGSQELMMKRQALRRLRYVLNQQATAKLDGLMTAAVGQPHAGPKQA